MKAQAFANTEPTEEEKKKFYEEIKDKLPYSYEIIKHELGSLIVEKRVQNQEKALLTEIEQKKGVKVFVLSPAAHKMQVRSKD